LALITTIFGLAVRIFINNFQLDLNSIERQVMTEVEQAANELVRKAKLNRKKI
jgi:biopolymer transport protein ExbB/TolQ